MRRSLAEEKGFIGRRTAANSPNELTTPDASPKRCATWRLLALVELPG